MKIEGVLEGNPGGAGQKQGWNLVFDLMPWRRLDDDARPDVPLRVEIPVTDAGLSRWMGRLFPGTPVRIAVDKLVKPGRRWPQWVAHATSVRVLPDAGVLATARAALDAPVVIRDATLGRLTLERSYRWYAGTRRAPGLRYELSVVQSSNQDDRDRDRADLERARAVVTRFERGMPAIRAAIGRKMHPLYERTWREERGPTFSRERFLSRVKLGSAVVYPDRTASLIFSCGTLFADHGIEVRLTSRGGVRQVGLA